MRDIVAGASATGWAPACPPVSRTIPANPIARLERDLLLSSASVFDIMINHPPMDRGKLPRLLPGRECTVRSHRLDVDFTTEGCVRREGPRVIDHHCDAAEL